MSALQLSLSPTAQAAHERHSAFHARLAAAADALAESKRPSPKPVAINPEAIPAETDPPRFPEFTEQYAPFERVCAYPSLAKIIEETRLYLGVSLVDIKSIRRDLPTVRARQIAMYLCRHLTPHSLPVIGNHFGGKDHTTVIHSVHKISALMRTDSDVAFHVAHLLRIITGVQQ